jgi:L-lactate dehydrogenase complex protein LldG
MADGQSLPQGSIHGREAFMRRIAGRLGRSEPLAAPPQRDVQGVPERYAAVKLSQEDNVRLFLENWSALKGQALVVKEADAPQAVAAWLKEIAAEWGVTRIARWDHDGLEALGFDETLRAAGIDVVPWRERADDPETSARDAAASPGGPNWAARSPLLRATERAQLGVVWPDYAVAGTGTLALLARGGQGRSVSLVTDILFAVFRADQLVTRLGEAFALIRERFPDAPSLPSSINLVTGPSRSADIENDLTIGVHGPGKVYAVIIE